MPLEWQLFSNMLNDCIFEGLSIDINKIIFLMLFSLILEEVLIARKEPELL